MNDPGEDAVITEHNINDDQHSLVPVAKNQGTNMNKQYSN